jgi:hypothetical protein
MTTANARLTYVWLLLSAITIAAWWLGPAHAHDGPVASVPITIAVLVLAMIKAWLIIRQFMEVRTAPRWLRVCTDVWIVALWGAILASYLW